MQHSTRSMCGEVSLIYLIILQTMQVDSLVCADSFMKRGFNSISHPKYAHLTSLLKAFHVVSSIRCSSQRLVMYMAWAVTLMASWVLEILRQISKIHPHWLREHYKTRLLLTSLAETFILQPYQIRARHSHGARVNLELLAMAVRTTNTSLSPYPQIKYFRKFLLAVAIPVS